MFSLVSALWKPNWENEHPKAVSQRPLRSPRETDPGRATWPIQNGQLAVLGGASGASLVVSRVMESNVSSVSPRVSNFYKKSQEIPAGLKVQDLGRDLVGFSTQDVF